MARKSALSTVYVQVKPSLDGFFAEVSKSIAPIQKQLDASIARTTKQAEAASARVAKQMDRAVKKSKISDIFSGGRNAFSGILTPFQKIGGILTSAARGFGAVITGIGRGFATIVTGSFRVVGSLVRSAFNGLTSVVSGAFRAGIKAAGIAGLLSTAIGAAFAGAGIVGGVNRLISIDDARSKLKGLKYDAAEIARIQQSALASVEGTRFALQDAFTLSTTALAAGVKSGQQLTDYLTTIADVSTIAGADLQDVGSILNKVLANQKLSALELNQLQDRGIPMLQWLADYLSVPPAQVRALIKKNKVLPKTVIGAINAQIGGAAKESGNTFSGSRANFATAINSAVANLLAPGLPIFTTVFQDLKAFVKRLEAIVTPSVMKLWDRYGGNISTGITKITDSIIRLVTDGSPFLDFTFRLLRVMASIAKTIGAGTWNLLENIFSNIDLGDGKGIIGILETVNDFIARIFDNLNSRGNGQAFGGLINQGADLISTLIGIFADIKDAFAPIFSEILSGASELGGVLAKTFSKIAPDVLSTLVKVFETLGNLIPVVLDAVSDLLPSITQIITYALPVVVAIIKSISGAVSALLPAITSLVSSLAPVFNKVFGVIAGIIEQLVPLITDILTGLEPVITRILTFIGGVLVEVGQLISALLSGANINAFIGLIEQLVTALIGIFKSIGKDVFTTLYTIIQTIVSLMPTIAKTLVAVAPVIADLIKTLLPIITEIIQQVAPLIVALLPVVQTILQSIAGIFAQISPAFMDLISTLATTLISLMPLLQPILQQLAGFIAQLAQSVLEIIIPLLPVIGKILTAILPILTVLIGIITQFLPVLQQMIQQFVPIIDQIADMLLELSPQWIGIVEQITPLIPQLVQLLEWALKFNFVLAGLSKVIPVVAWLLSKMYSIFDYVLSHVIGLFKTTISTVMEYASKIIDFLRGIPGVGSIIDRIAGGVSSANQQVFGMANGGTVNPRVGGTMVRLAEQGRPESVVDTGLLNRNLALQNDLMRANDSKSSAANNVVTQSFNIYQQPGESTEQLVRRIRDFQVMNDQYFPEPPEDIYAN